MSKRRNFKLEETIEKLREAEVLLGKGLTTGQTCRKIGIRREFLSLFKVGATPVAQYARTLRVFILRESA